MARRADLEESIRSSYELIRKYEEILRAPHDPKEKDRTETEIREQWDSIRKWLVEYSRLVQGPFPDDIAEIAIVVEIPVPPCLPPTPPPLLSKPVPSSQRIYQEYVGDRHGLYERALRDNGVIGIWGEPGWGKTWVGEKIALRWQNAEISFAPYEDSPRQVLWFDCKPTTTFQDLIVSMANYVGEQDGIRLGEWIQKQTMSGALNSQYVLPRLLSLLGQQQYMLCFDDFHFLEGKAEVSLFFQQLKNHLKQSQTRAILISRARIPSKIGVWGHELSSLTMDNIVEFFQKMGGVFTEPTKDTAVAFTQKAVELVGYNMKLMGVLAMECIQTCKTGEEALALLVSIEQRIEKQSALRAALGPKDQRSAGIMLLVDALEGSADMNTLKDLAQAVGLAGPGFQDHLENLISSQLVDRKGAKQYSVHNTVQDWAEQVIAESFQQELLHQGIGNYFLAQAQKAQRKGSLYWQAFYQYIQAKAYAQALRVLFDHVLEIAEVGKAEEALKQLDKISKAAGSGEVVKLDNRQWIWIYILRSFLNNWLGESRKAKAAATRGWDRLARIKTGGMEYEKAWLHARMGITLADAGNYQKAIEHLSQSRDAMKAFVNTTEDEGEITIREYELMRVLDNLGTALLWEEGWQKPEKAIACFEEMYDRALAEGDTPKPRYWAARSLVRLAQVHNNPTDRKLALKHAEEALDIFKELGNEWGIGFAEEELGRICLGLQEYDQAYQYYEASLRRAKETNDKEGCINGLLALGGLDLVKGDLAESAQHFTEVRGILSQAPSAEDYYGPFLEAYDWWREGIELVQDGQAEEGQEKMHQAWHVFYHGGWSETEQIEYTLTRLELELPEPPIEPPVESEPSAPKDEHPVESSTEPTPTEPGSPSISGTFIGRYRVVEELGGGGIGIVYKAHDPNINRIVAIKVLKPFSGRRADELMERFRREAQAIGRLDHPNIVQVYDADTFQGQWHIVMEYLEGRTLEDVIAQEDALSLEQIADIVSQACAALSYAHERQIIHRDIKPANIVLLDTGQVKVLDFGFASIADEASLTQIGDFFGSPHYASPEQVRDTSSVDLRTDIFSLGVVIYELLTGKKLFPGEKFTPISNINSPEPADLSELEASFPVAVQDVMSKALSKDLNKRYSSCAEFEQDFMQAVFPPSDQNEPPATLLLGFG